MNNRESAVRETIVITPRSRYELARFELAEAASVFARAQSYATEERLRVVAIAHTKALTELLGWYVVTGRKVPEDLAELACLVPELKVKAG